MRETQHSYSHVRSTANAVSCTFQGQFPQVPSVDLFDTSQLVQLADSLKKSWAGTQWFISLFSLLFKCCCLKLSVKCLDTWISLGSHCYSSKNLAVDASRCGSSFRVEDILEACEERPHEQSGKDNLHMNTGKLQSSVRRKSFSE